MKKCSTCKQEKPREDFPKNKRMKDGLHNQCKDCKRQYNILNRKKPNAAQRRYREKNKEKFNQYVRDHRQREEDRAWFASEQYKNCIRFGENPELITEMLEKNRNKKTTRYEK